MASTINETHTLNTPQPNGSKGPGASGHSPSWVDLNASPAASTHEDGATSGATSQSNLFDSHNQTQTASASQNSHNQNAEGVQGDSRDTRGINEPAEEEGGAARGSGTRPAEGENAPSQNIEPAGGYPEQLHAGKLDGPGPEYGKIHHVTMGDRIHGLKEGIKGSIQRDPELRRTGKERMTGELKRKQQESENGTDPFQTAEDDKKDKREKKAQTENTGEPGLTRNPQALPNEKMRGEQVSSILPEGNGPPPAQRQKENVSASGTS